MRQLTFALLTLLFLSTALTAQGQENKTTEQKPSAPTITADSEQPKNAVEKMIATVREKGAKVVSGCLEDCENADSSDYNGHAISLPKPAYPPIARAAHAQGTVEVNVLIDFEGKVIAAAAISGHPLLQAACVQAARNSLFKPIQLDGEPVMVTGVLRYNFVTQ
jgi:TonB family protein